MTFLEVNLSIIIDNIDTASDIAKDNDELYRKLVQEQIEKFRTFISSDGYRFFKIEKKDEPPQEDIIKYLNGIIQQLVSIGSPVMLFNLSLNFLYSKQARVRPVPHNCLLYKGFMKLWKLDTSF